MPRDPPTVLLLILSVAVAVAVIVASVLVNGSAAPTGPESERTVTTALSDAFIAASSPISTIRQDSNGWVFVGTSLHPGEADLRRICAVADMESVSNRVFITDQADQLLLAC